MHEENAVAVVIGFVAVERDSSLSVVAADVVDVGGGDVGRAPHVPFHCCVPYWRDAWPWAAM